MKNYRNILKKTPKFTPKHPKTFTYDTFNFHKAIY